MTLAMIRANPLYDAASRADPADGRGFIDCNPPGLLVDGVARWFVVHCLPRQEKRLADDLRRHRIGRALFLERRLRRYPGKGVQESLVPLLGGYLFVDGGERERMIVYDTGRAVRVLPVPRPDQLAQDLRQLTVLLTAVPAAPLVVKPEIVPGDTVTLVSGVFAGCTGIVVRRQGCEELVVNINALGTSVSVRLPALTAERLAPAVEPG